MGRKRRNKLTDFIEVRNLGDIAQIDHSKVLYFLRHAIESFIHGHALGIPVVAKPNDDDPVLLRFDSLIDVPARREVWKKVRHGQGTRSRIASHFKPRVTRKVLLIFPSRTLLPPSSTMSSNNNTTRPVVFMDINIGETPAGRLKMELFSDIVPKYDPLIFANTD